tara:strand:+ start:179 stop:1714 length:1536 start_codon:yes stop_codon:yes gene_type:complete
MGRSFFFKFAIPEFKFILGNKFSNLLVLSIILIFSMLAIGLGKGAIKYLDKKMNNPFVSFVNVKIPADNKYSLEKIKEIHNKKNNNISFSDYYGFAEPYPVFDDYVNFANNELGEGKFITKNAKIRRAREDDPIYNFILENPENANIVRDNDFQYDGWGCVVSLEYLKNDKTKLVYSNIDNVAYLPYKKTVDQYEYFINIPIQGFVESFPDDIDVIVGTKFFDAKENIDYWSSLILPDTNKTYNLLQFYVINNNEVEKYLISNGFEEIDSEDIIHNTGKMYYLDGISLNKKQTILSNLPNKKNCYEILDFYSQSVGKTYDLQPESYVFQFQKDKLMNIEKLNAFLKEETMDDGKRLEIDMRIIESKKNFDLFKKLGDLLSIALIAFSILSLVLYITNLIISHISKNKKSLGTLKAFGLSNNSIIFIYSTISIAMVSISFIFGLFISQFTGTFLIRFVGSFFEIGDVNTLSYVSYPIYWLATFFIVLPSIAIYCKLWFQLRKSTPGDLIYER